MSLVEPSVANWLVPQAIGWVNLRPLVNTIFCGWMRC
jgi:hypothetical protein